MSVPGDDFALCSGFAGLYWKTVREDAVFFVGGKILKGLAKVAAVDSLKQVIL